MRCVVKSNLDHDGKRYEAGEEVDLTKDQARLAKDAVEPASKKDQKDADAPQQ